MLSRKCWICKELKPLDADTFYHNKNKPDGCGTECKECHKRKGQERRTARRRLFIESRGNMCARCGLKHEDFKFFDLDHIVPLNDTKSPRGWRNDNGDNLQVLCPNCHRVKTMQDMEWGKYEV